MRAKAAWVFAGLLTANAAIACPACGDKLGFGPGFTNAKRAPPGHVLILAAPDSAFASQTAGIRGALEREGHEVVVAQSPDELSHQLREHATDIVLTHWSEAASTDPLLAAGPDSPTVVPIAFADRDAAAAKTEGADRCLARSDQKRGRKLAEAIDKILEQRRKGAPPECVATTIAKRTD